MRTTTFLLASLLFISAVAQQEREPLVYPNPAQYDMSVRVSREVRNVIVFDLLGSELVSVKLKENHSRKVVIVKLPADIFPSGLYVVSLRADGERVLECERFRIVN